MRRMRGSAVTAGAGALAALLLLGGAATALAQDGEPATPQPVEVRVGAVFYDLPPDEALAVCVDALTDDALGTTLTLRPFVNVLNEGWLPLPTYPAEAVGALAAAGQGDCFALDPEQITEPEEDA